MYIVDTPSNFSVTCNAHIHKSCTKLTEKPCRWYHKLSHMAAHASCLSQHMVRHPKLTMACALDTCIYNLLIHTNIVKKKAVCSAALCRHCIASYYSNTCHDPMCWKPRQWLCVGQQKQACQQYLFVALAACCLTSSALCATNQFILGSEPSQSEMHLIIRSATSDGVVTPSVYALL